jgi:hypothetical protein
LSGDLVRLLGRWAVKPDGTDEERALAKALHDDFSQYDATPSSSSSTGAGALPTPMLNGAEAVAEAALAADAANATAADGGQRMVLGMDREDACRVVADRTVVSSVSPAHSTPARAAAVETGGGAGFGSSVLRDSGEDAAGDIDCGEHYKTRGNEAYSRGAWTDAIAQYGRAINAPVSYHKLFDEAPRRAVYHANRAAAYLARGASPGGE